MKMWPVRPWVEWVNGEILEDLDYAVDLALVSEYFDDLQEKSKRLDKRARRVGLKSEHKED